MPPAGSQMDVYLEIGKKRTFAGVLDWPGWCRSGRDEEAALQALLDCGARYGRVLEGTGLDFSAPDGLAAFNVVQRLEGTGTTDFGAPGVIPQADSEAVDDVELGRLQTILQACWQAFDAARQTATGRELRKGPRGGGRDLHKIVQHVQGAEEGYLKSLGWKHGKQADGELAATREAVLEGLTAAAHGETPTRGPRGGVRWPPRYFARRVAWHVLDHAWEIEDRLI